MFSGKIISVDRVCSFVSVGRKSVFFFHYINVCAQLFNVTTTCHNIPLGGSGNSVTPAVPRPLGSTLSQSGQRGLSNTNSFQML